MSKVLRILIGLIWLVTCSAFAFPVRPDPAFLVVSPYVPSPSEHAIILVYDMTENGIQAYGPIQNVTVTRTGNSIQISAGLGYIASASAPYGPGFVDLGVL